MLRAGCILAIALLATAAPSFAESRRRPAFEAVIAAEEPRLRAAFAVRPHIVTFDDGDTPNAIGGGRHLPSGFSGTILLGVNLASGELEHPLKGVAALVGILAHEFAHVVQAQRRAAIAGHARELHADFLAGWYCGGRTAVLRDLRGFAIGLWDRATRDAESGHGLAPDAHGSPRLRVAAMLAGFDRRERRLDEAFAEGLRWVEQIEPADPPGPLRPEAEAALPRRSGADDRIWDLVGAPIPQGP